MKYKTLTKWNYYKKSKDQHDEKRGIAKSTETQKTSTMKKLLATNEHWNFQIIELMSLLLYSLFLFKSVLISEN